MKLKQAKALQSGDYIHSKSRFNSDSTPMRARITSVKTWKTRPDSVLVKYKRGLYEHGTLNQNEICDFSLGYGS